VFSMNGSMLRAVLAGLCLTSLAAALAAPAVAADPHGFDANMSTSISIPLDNSCPRSNVQSGSLLTAGLGSNQTETIVVGQEEGAILSGTLRGTSGGIAGASICIYSDVVTDEEGQLLGIAVTGEDGGYEFAIPPGPSRNLTAVYRTDQGQLSAWTLLQAQVTPTLRLRSSVVHNKHFAYFSGEIAGPHNDHVLVFIQVKSGNGWRVFKRYDTRAGGKFFLRYRFTRTFSPTTYIVRAQVLGTPGYPYLGGNSKEKALRVLP
jgi:hypothetical protein